MRAHATAVLLMFALLATSAGAIAQDPVTHWRTVAGRALVHHADKAHDALDSLEVPAVDAEAVVAEAEATVEAAGNLDPQGVVDGLGLEGLVPTLPALPGVPALADAAGFLVRVVQHQGATAVRLYEHLKP